MGAALAPLRGRCPERLLSLLDKAKAYQLFQKDHTDALAGVLHSAPGATNYYDNFRVIIGDYGGSKRRTLSSSASTSRTRQRARFITTSPRTLRFGSKSGSTRSPSRMPRARWSPNPARPTCLSPLSGPQGIPVEVRNCREVRIASFRIAESMGFTGDLRQ